MTDEELINGLRQNTLWVTTHDAADRIEALTARLAKAVEALRVLDKAASDVSRLGAVTGSQWSRMTLAMLNARAVLAEIEGKP